MLGSRTASLGRQQVPAVTQCSLPRTYSCSQYRPVWAEHRVHARSQLTSRLVPDWRAQCRMQQSFHALTAGVRPCAHQSKGTCASSEQPAMTSRRCLLSLGAAALLASTLPPVLVPSGASAAADTPSLPVLRSGASQGGPAPLEGPVRQAVEAALKKVVDKGKAPMVLRLVFHDAATYDAAAQDGGANASVQYELDRPENFGLKRGWRVVEAAQKALEGTAAEGKVSSADLVALAGAYAVRMTGGPAIEVPIGRRDAPVPDPENRMPVETLSAEQQRAAFAAKDITVRDMVAALGAHTIGGKGFGDPLTFDNAYYKALLLKPWESGDSMAAMIGLPSDHVLPDDRECRPFIELYARDQEAFFRDFAASYLKLTSLGAVWG